MQAIRTVIMILVSVALSVLLVGHIVSANSGFVTVNLTRIINAQRMLVIRSSSHDNAGWIAQAGDASKRLKVVIDKVAAGRPVLISQAVVSGTVDITPEVLQRLGLPVNVPDITPTKAQILGGGLGVSAPQSQGKSQQPKQKSMADFLRP